MGSLSASNLPPQTLITLTGALVLRGQEHTSTATGTYRGGRGIALEFFCTSKFRHEFISYAVPNLLWEIEVISHSHAVTMPLAMLDLQSQNIKFQRAFQEVPGCTVRTHRIRPYPIYKCEAMFGRGN